MAGALGVVEEEAGSIWNAVTDFFTHNTIAKTGLAAGAAAAAVGGGVYLFGNLAGQGVKDFSRTTGLSTFLVLALAGVAAYYLLIHRGA